ncbi:rhomboid family intramembrane serine protease [Puniceibacterium confluentis]|uniref:rhomboid family intramembrane serine protease n=1 Tax=Puniceibacterium confluentis TaxID=1958944 RepID=UPI0011B48F82|nr:rhomboid family intramembrane serine protease [Puniceibacterium confluentis]
MKSPHNESPVNPLPPVVVALFLLMVGVEVTFSLGARGIIGGPGAVGWRLEAIERYAFSGQILNWMLATGQYPVEHLMRLVTYPFIHGSFTHALVGAVMLLALGKMVGEVFGALATLAIFVLSSVGGALAYGLIVETPVPLIGAFPAVYGLIGAFTYLLWVRLGEMGAQQLRAFSLIGMLLGLQLLFGLLFGSSNDWVADLGGFCVGLGLSLFLVPGGWRKILSLVRRD